MLDFPAVDLIYFQNTLLANWRTWCCLPNFGRCGQSHEGVWVNRPLVNRLYPAAWMPETLFHTVYHPSWHRRDRPKLGRQQ